MADRLNFGAGAGARALLGLLLLFVHGLGFESLATSLFGYNGRRGEAPRLQVVYLRQMSLAPPAPASVHGPSLPRLIEPNGAAPLSLLDPVDAAAIALAAQAESTLVVDDPLDETAATPIESAPATVDSATQPRVAGADSEPPYNDLPGASGDSAGLPDFVWPASTRLSYVLTGNYRGEVHGAAQVEWINARPRYQVNLDVTVGLPFAPLYKREMRSDGRLDENGLNPQHFQQQSKLAFQPLRRVGVQIGADSATTDDGRPLPRTFAAADAARHADHRTNLQDSASQFVQMTYLFTTQPQLLTPGTRIGFPLLLPAGVREWVYEVGQQQTIHTRFGAVEAFHVKSATGLSRGRDQLLAEAWFAPRLAYLPVRLRIEQHADLYLDMILARIPELAGP